VKRKSEIGNLEPAHIEAFIHGDMQAFKQVYAKYRQRVLTYCLYFMSDHALAEDAFQEVFTRVYTHREQLRNPGALTTWIIMITRTVCLNMLRTSKFTPEFVPIENIESGEKHEPATTNTPLDQQIMDEELAHALARLPLMYRDAFLLCEFEGYTYEEIAGMTNTNAHNVQVRITRAKKMLREYLMPSESPVREVSTKAKTTAQKERNVAIDVQQGSMIN